jgi:hypothetical protein
MMEEIFRSDKVFQFWPTEKQPAKERVYATTRFILYLACILYIIRRDVRILIMAAVALGALYYMYKNGMIRDTEYVYSQKTSGESNLMNNGIPNVGPPDRKSFKEEWDKVHPFMEGRWFSEHNFYTAPGVDNQRFIEGAYGDMLMPVCRDNSEFCNINSSMGRGVESVQRRTMFGGGQNF